MIWQKEFFLVFSWTDNPNPDFYTGTGTGTLLKEAKQTKQT